MRNFILILLLPLSLAAQTAKPRSPVAPSGSWADGLIRAYLFSWQDSVKADSVQDWSSNNVWGIVVNIGANAWTSISGTADAPAFKLTGTNDYINAGALTSLGIDDSISVFGIFNDVGNGVQRYPLALQDRLDTPDKGFWFRDDDGTSPYDWQFGVNTGSGEIEAVADSIPNDGTAPYESFFSILGIYDGANIHAYRNGVLQASSAVTGTIITDANYGFNIGRGAGAGSFRIWSDGIVAAVYLWNRVLTSEEIASLRTDPYVMFRIADSQNYYRKKLTDQ